MLGRSGVNIHPANRILFRDYRLVRWFCGHVAFNHRYTLTLRLPILNNPLLEFVSSLLGLQMFYIGFGPGGNAGTVHLHDTEGFHNNMTYLEVVFSYSSAPGEQELRAIDSMGEVYGVRRIQFNEIERTVRV